MTWIEFKKVKFKMVAHLSLADQYQAIYSDKSGRLGFCDITERKSEFEIGESQRAYRIDGKWYDTKEEFINALKHFAFGPQEPIRGGKL